MAEENQVQQVQQVATRENQVKQENLFMYNTGMVMPGLNTHILEARGSKLQIADLLYFRQLIYLTINKAMYFS